MDRALPDRRHRADHASDVCPSAVPGAVIAYICVWQKAGGGVLLWENASACLSGLGLDIRDWRGGGSGPGGAAQKDQTDGKQQGQGGDARLGGVEQLGGQTHQQGAEKGGPFAENIEEAEVFRGLFPWE